MFVRLSVLHSKTALLILTYGVSKDSLILCLPNKFYFHLHIFMTKSLHYNLFWSQTSQTVYTTTTMTSTSYFLFECLPQKSSLFKANTAVSLLLFQFLPSSKHKTFYGRMHSKCKLRILCIRVTSVLQLQYTHTVNYLQLSIFGRQ